MDQSKSVVVPKRSPSFISKCQEIAQAGWRLVWPEHAKGGTPERESRADASPS